MGQGGLGSPTRQSPAAGTAPPTPPPRVPTAVPPAVPPLPILNPGPPLEEGQGQTLAASCTAEGNPVPSVRWETEVRGTNTTRSSDHARSASVTSEFFLVPGRSMNGKSLTCVVAHPGLRHEKRITHLLSVACAAPGAGRARGRGVVAAAEGVEGHGGIGDVGGIGEVMVVVGVEGDGGHGDIGATRVMVGIEGHGEDGDIRDMGTLGPWGSWWALRVMGDVGDLRDMVGVEVHGVIGDMEVIGDAMVIAGIEGSGGHGGHGDGWGHGGTWGCAGH